MAYAPLETQRRFLMGMPAPLGALAAIGLGFGLLPRLRRTAWARSLVRRGIPWPRQRNLLLTSSVAVASLSTWYLTFSGAHLAAGREPALFDPRPVAAAVEWLDSVSRWDATVLASERTATLILTRIGHRVYLGHFNQTLDYAGKTAALAAFFAPDGMDDAGRRSLLQTCGCAYVFVGPYERTLGDWDPDSVEFLSPVFENEMAAVYRVRP